MADERIQDLEQELEQMLQEKKRLELEELKQMKDYIRDQMKHDIDYLKNVLVSDDINGTVARLQALRRAITVVDPAVVAKQIHFKKGLQVLKVISRRAKAN